MKYLDDYAKHNLTPRGIGDLTARVKRNANLLFKKTLRDITKQDILDIFHKTSNVGRVEANRTISYLSAIFNKGIEWELVDKNPVFGIKKHKEHSRDRYITLEEKEQFLNALDAEKDQQIKDFVYISLYTGARKSNVLSMRWEDISFDQGVWYIKDTKNGDPQNVVLIEDAVKILERRKLKSKSEWVFPSKDSKSGHFQEPRKGWVRICKRAGIEDLRIHDLRRTCGSWMALNGASQYIIGKMLGHKSPQSTAIYARLSLDPVREHMEKAINLKNGDLQRKIEELKRKQEEENNL
jgi:integrase